MNWSRSVSDRLIVAIDRRNRYSHPRRWRIEKYLEEIAIKRMSEVLEAAYQSSTR